MTRNELCRYLNDYLDIASFGQTDISTNGLVVGAPADKEVRKVALAVDASLSTFRLAAQWGADLLFTHHGLFWGHPLPVTGSHYERLAFLLAHGIDLFVCHLPLDAHPVVGNNAVMAKMLGLENIVPFAPWHGKEIGMRGTSPKALNAEEITRKLGFDTPIILPYGKKDIHSVGIVSGGASDDVESAIALGLDCFITGSVQHEQFADCVENRMTMIGGGHYRSEVFGVQAVGSLLEREFSLECRFLANPTGL